MKLSPYQKRWYTEEFDGIRVTKRQLECLEVIESYWREYCEAPTLRDLGIDLGITYRGVDCIIQGLKKVGLVENVDRRSRTLRTKRMKMSIGKDGTFIFWDKAHDMGN
jgi:hypothetical protein